MAKVWNSNIHHLGDTCQHFLKTYFLLRTLLHLIPRAPVISTCKLWGGWTQWQRIQSSSIHCYWDTPQHFSQNTSLLRKWLSFIPSTRIEMTCIPLQKTWQMSLLWLMDPLVPEQRWLAYHYTQLGRWTYFGWTQWQRFESSSTHHFWVTPTAFSQNTSLLTKWFSFIPSTRAERTCIPLYKTWQMNLLWLMDPLVSEQRCLAYHYTNLAEHNGKGFKALALTISEIPHSIFSKHIFA